MADTTSPSITVPPYRSTSARPAARNSAGVIPSRVRKLWMPSAGAFRPSPESITSTERNARPRATAPLSPAGPPPITITS